jgi:hypothetical protein
MQGIGVIGFAIEDPPINGLGFGEPTGLVVANGPFQVQSVRVRHGGIITEAIRKR